MEGLSFEKMPHYHFSSNRQFKKGECHLDRIYELSVLLLVRKGILRFTENGIPIEVKEGEYYIQKANLYQQGVIPSDEPNYYFIHFSGHYSNAGALPIRGNFSFDKIQPIIMQIELLSESAERLEKEALFYALLCELKKGSGHKSTAEQIRTFLLSNYKKDINLSDLSKNFYLSKNQIINVFKNTYNTTPFQYLLNFRLTKAGELILASNQTINEICFETGFTDYTAFFRAFKRKFGASPIDYRTIHSTAKLPTDIYFNHAP